MVGRRRHGADAVATAGQAAGDFGLDTTLTIASIVNTLEEGKLGRIKGLSRVERVAGVLDSDVGVADDLASSIEILGRGVVGARRVGEGTQLHVLDLEHNVEGRELLEVVKILGVQDDGRDHAVN